jgi:hypothetical protein
MARMAAGPPWTGMGRGLADADQAGIGGEYDDQLAHATGRRGRRADGLRQ